MSSRALFPLLTAALLSVGCPFPTPSIDDTSYRCATDADCVSGYGCELAVQVCVPASELSPGVLDAGLADAGRGDGGLEDAGLDDGGLEDGGLDDGGLDAGQGDAGRDDAGQGDAGRGDAGLVDGGRDDAGLVDGGSPDAGPLCPYACDEPLICDGDRLACVEPLCGNGRLDPSEACDDANGSAGDGCAPSCQQEPGWRCFGAPSACAPPGSTVIEVPGDASDVRDALDGLPGGAEAWIFVDGDDYGFIGDGACGLQTRISIDNKTVRLIGEGRPIISPAGSGAGIHIRNDSDVTIRGFELSTRCGVIDSVFVEASRLVLEDNDIHGQGYGLRATNDARVEVRRNRIHHNTSGGMYVDTQRYRIESNFIYRNGSPGLSSAGAALQKAPLDDSYFFRFNTVVFNDTASGNVGGVYCNDDDTPLVAIIARGNAGAQVQSQKCVSSSSSITGTGNALDTDPLFVAPHADDFHLRADSPLLDQGGPSGPGRDLDGQARPYRAAFDIGADEVPE